MISDLTPDQRELRSAAREVLKSACPPQLVRGAWNDPGWNPLLRSTLAEVGFLGVTVPEEFGGLGMTDLELTLILEECGRVALPAPVLESMVATSMLVDYGSDDQRSQWISALTTGEAAGTIGLEGQVLLVGARQAQLLICAVGDELHAVPIKDVELIDQPVFDHSRSVSIATIQVGADTLMTSGRDAVERLRNRAAIATAAFLLGLADWMLETTTAYVKQRSQFGRPVGSFQAVKHRLAEAHLLIETARPAVWAAAQLVADDSPDASLAASVAKIAAVQAEAATNEHALQSHGGMGFTWDYDLQLWLKRGKALEQIYGTPGWHRARVANELFARVTG